MLLISGIVTNHGAYTRRADQSTQKYIELEGVQLNINLVDLPPIGREFACNAAVKNWEGRLFFTVIEALEPGQVVKRFSNGTVKSP